MKLKISPRSNQTKTQPKQLQTPATPTNTTKPNNTPPKNWITVILKTSQQKKKNKSYLKK